jgi:response regulator RpfG family c-di-GMP phosphodiesterase
MAYQNIKNKSILIVDDEIYNITRTASFLKEFTDSIDTASNGQNAIMQCQNNYYDLILMDLMMPIIDLINLEEIFTSSLMNSDNLELEKEVYILNYNNSELINKKIRSLIKKKLHDNHQHKFKFMELKNIINLNIITRPISESINHDFNFSD